MRPPLPGGDAASTREKSSQLMPNASRTRSRASDPFLKQVNPMKAPVGDPKTWPVPDGSTRGVRIRPKIVSLVPSEIATRPSATRPVPTRLHGLSPDHATTRAGGSWYRCCQYGDKRPTMVEEGASDGSLSISDGAVASI